MAVLDPVSPFLALIDRLISLIQTRKTRRKDYFEKIIDPLYTQFCPLGENSLNLFRAALKTLDGPKKARKRGAEELKAKRDEFSSARAKLRALLEQCEKHSKKQKDQDVADFVRSMLRYFSPTVTTSPNSLGRELIFFFDLWVREWGPTPRLAGEGSYRGSGSWKIPSSEEELRFYIQQATARMESSWYEIAGRYMDLKLKYVVE